MSGRHLQPVEWLLRIILAVVSLALRVEVVTAGLIIWKGFLS